MKTIVGVLTFCSLSLSTQAADLVDLVFAWKPGMSCQVTNSVKTLKGQQGTITFNLKTSAASGGGLLVELTDARPVQPSLPGASDITALMMPDFVVDAEGNFVRLRDLEKSRAAVRKLIEREWPTNSPDKKEKMLDVLGSQAMLENTVHMLWNPAVVSWSGTSWEPQERLQMTIDQEFPIGNIPYKAALEAQFVGLKPCNESKQTNECALLIARQKPDPAEFKELTKKVIASFGGSTDDMESFELDLRIDTETLTRPESMVPSRVLFEKHLSVKGIENGKPRNISQSERREWIFNCN